MVEEENTKRAKRIEELSDKNFKEKALSGTCAVVYAWAEWCGPCKKFAPVFEEVSQSFDSNIVFYKINVESAPDFVRDYGIKGIPSILLFKDSSLVEKISGSLSKEKLTETVRSFLGPDLLKEV